MKEVKWPGFTFTLAVRFTFDVFWGCLACLVSFWRGILRSFSHDNTGAPRVPMILCRVVGGAIAVFTVPHWQTPWYKGMSGQDDNDA